MRRKLKLECHHCEHIRAQLDLACAEQVSDASTAAAASGEAISFGPTTSEGNYGHQDMQTDLVGDR